MPEVLTIDGIAGPSGKKQRKAAGLREVVSVRESDTHPGVCVPNRYGPEGAAGGRRMSDLCLSKGLKKMRIGGREIDLGGGTQMADYSGTDFPPLDDLGQMEIVPDGFISGNAMALGAYAGSRLLGDLANLLPGPDFVKPLTRGVAGLVAGRLLWGVSEASSQIVLANLLGRALYDDLLAPMALAKIPTVGPAFAGVSVPEVRLLSQLSQTTRNGLAGSSVERDEVLGDSESVDDSDDTESFSVQGVSSWLS